MLSLGFGMITCLGQLSLAQTYNPDENTQPNEESINGTSTFGNSFKPLDIIHRANLGRGRDMSEFNQDSQDNLNDAATEFKRLQQERLQNSPAENSVNSTPSN